MSYEAPMNIDPLRGTQYDFPRDHVGFGRHPPNPQWPNGAKIAVSFVINYEEGAERTTLNGDPQSENMLWEQAHIAPRVGERAVNVESDYDYGSRRGVWRLLNILEEHKMQSTVYAVGMALEKNPDVVKAFVDGGHEIASHGYRWIDYHTVGLEKEKAFVHRQMECLKTLTGEYPVGWYYGRLSPYSKALVHEVHQELEAPLLWEADTYADDLPYWVDVPAEKDAQSPRGMLMMPYSYDCNDLKYCAPHGWGSVGAFTEYLKNAFDILGKPGRAAALRDFVEYISAKEGVWVARRKDIAIHFREKFPYRKGHVI
ncbi:Glycoside hydrolase/deacetylase, beta/alpha-barrel [Pleurostoma richardsiae]|uniref:Glycoside hydrolase/deacetylase, beta/alpha-barrel n=1 Tax=Pleurostoma richardsiae TaxID=41990 RepID=A0AA38RJQ5_9PEZI|nr:Glycoside hydrolase/deacetylase, beta/alpha-barrel [Pleurostoma richardsiae]